MRASEGTFFKSKESSGLRMKGALRRSRRKRNFSFQVMLAESFFKVC